MGLLKLKNEEFEVKSNVRTMMYYEENVDTYSVKKANSIKANIVLLFSSLQACNIGKFNYTLEEFLDILDENPELLNDAMKSISGNGVVKDKINHPEAVKEKK